MTLMLTQEDLQYCGADDIDLIGKVLEQAFLVHHDRQFTQPSSLFLKRQECPHVADRAIAMPAYVGGDFDTEGIKWIASSHRNLSRGLPRANAVIILNDADTRVPIAIMEGALISAVRTAVIQGLAFRELARDDAEIVGLVGCGRIGALILYVLRKWFPSVREYRIWDQSQQRAEEFRRHCRQFDIDPVLMPDFISTFADADCAIVATTAEKAYVPAHCFKSGGLFMNVSLMDAREDLVHAADKIVVDDWSHSIYSNRVLGRMFQAGSLTKDDLHAELGDIIAGKRPGRENANERIFWNPFGMAIEDLAVAKVLYERACELNVGSHFEFCGSESEFLL